MHRFKAGDWILMGKSPTSSHVEGKLFRVEQLVDGGYIVSRLYELGDTSTHISEGLAIDGSNEHYALSIRAKVMGVPDNLALAEYMQDLELRIMRRGRILASEG